MGKLESVRRWITTLSLAALAAASCSVIAQPPAALAHDCADPQGLKVLAGCLDRPTAGRPGGQGRPLRRFDHAGGRRDPRRWRDDPGRDREVLDRTGRPHFAGWAGVEREAGVSGACPGLSEPAAATDSAPRVCGSTRPSRVGRAAQHPGATLLATVQGGGVGT